ncbi:MAG: MFS transporter [Planctomycetes bacterium]|nr:MFS transporter [Planctomycetota bacterium]
MQSNESVSNKEKSALALGMVCAVMGYNGIVIVSKQVLHLTFGISPEIISSVLGSMSLWNGFLDPFMGPISDNFRSKYGRRRPFILLGALGMGLIFPFIWFVRPDWSSSYQVFYLVICLMAFYVAFTVFAVPYGTINTELTPSYSERTKLRGIMTMTSMVVILALGWFFPLTQYGWLGDALTSTRILGTVIGLIMIASGVLAAYLLSTKKVELEEGKGKISMLKSFSQMARDRIYLSLVATGILTLFSASLVDYLGDYLIIFFVFEGDIVKGASVAAMSASMTQILGFLSVLVIGKTMSHMDKKKLLGICMAITLLGNLSKWFLLRPEFPLGPLLLPLYLAPAHVGFWMLFSSMMADYPDYHEFRYGKRCEGTIFAIHGWFTKVAAAIALTASGFILTYSGFRAELGGEQAEGTFLSMRLLIVFLPSICLALGLLALKMMPLDKVRMLEIRKQLDERKV